MQKAGQTEVGVLNEGIIGNRLLQDSPADSVDGLFGKLLGESGLNRFDRDVLNQPGIKYVVLGLGINDIAFPGSLTRANEQLTAEMIIAGYRQLIARAHHRGVKIIGTTNPPMGNSFLALPARTIMFYTPEKEIVRQKVNEWILHSGGFDAVIDLDQVVRDQKHPTQINPVYDSGDHLHPNDSGAAAEANAFPLEFFGRWKHRRQEQHQRYDDRFRARQTDFGCTVYEARAPARCAFPHIVRRNNFGSEDVT